MIGAALQDDGRRIGIEKPVIQRIDHWEEQNVLTFGRDGAVHARLPAGCQPDGQQDESQLCEPFF